MTKVLIALDFDPTAQKVAEVGFSLAKTMGAEITLLHVIVDPVFYSSYENFPLLGFFGTTTTTPLHWNNSEELYLTSQHFLDKMKHHLGDEAIQTVIKEGNHADAILKTAKQMNVDIIVLGSHSHKWLDNILLVGSVTEEVLRKATIPVCIVPTQKYKK
jgi:nucleotide-binding universal stress UspA family protein